MLAIRALVFQYSLFADATSVEIDTRGRNGKLWKTSTQSQSEDVLSRLVGNASNRRGRFIAKPVDMASIRFPATPKKLKGPRKRNAVSEPESRKQKNYTVQQKKDQTRA